MDVLCKGSARSVPLGTRIQLGDQWLAYSENFCREFLEENMFSMLKTSSFGNGRVHPIRYSFLSRYSMYSMSGRTYPSSINGRVHSFAAQPHK